MAPCCPCSHETQRRLEQACTYTCDQIVQLIHPDHGWRRVFESVYPSSKMVATMICSTPTNAAAPSARDTRHSSGRDMHEARSSLPYTDRPDVRGCSWQRFLAARRLRPPEQLHLNLSLQTQPSRQPSTHSTHWIEREREGEIEREIYRERERGNKETWCGCLRQAPQRRTNQGCICLHI